MEKDQTIVYWNIAEAVPDRDGLTGVDCLSESERRRLDGMRFEKRRREWLLGRRTAKTLLCGSLEDLRGVNPADLSIENEPEGAPFVVYGSQRLDISLSTSHRDGLAVCAMSSRDGISVGADIEKIEAREPAFAGDYFTEAEQQIIVESPDNMRDLTITLIWSAKEAMLKAMRKGLRLDTRSVEISSIHREDGEWNSFIAHSQSSRGSWARGWWRIRGEYVLTLVVLSRANEIDPGHSFHLAQINA